MLGTPGYLLELFEIYEAWNEGAYFGPGTTDFSAEPISRLDRAAQRHDFVYASNPDTRSGRAGRARGDLDMAREVGGLTGIALTTQAMIRVFTFNQVSIPWAD